jgi:hypothetical protein
MASARTASDVRKTATVIQAALAAVSLELAGLPAQAGELPTFRHGLWEFTRTLDMGGGEKTISSRRCTEPGEEMSRQNAMLAKAGCTVSPVSRQGNAYSFVADCKGGGMGKVVSRSVITVESDASYTVEIESSGDVGPGTGKRREVLKAHRVSDCP